MTSMKELVELGTKQGFLKYSFVRRILEEEVGLMPDQIEDLMDALRDLGIIIKNEN